MGILVLQRLGAPVIENYLKGLLVVSGKPVLFQNALLP